MDIACALSALLFFVGNIFIIVYGVLEIQTRQENMSAFKSLDPAFIQIMWTFRRQWEAFEISAGLINALAWVLFTIPMVQLAWVLSLGGRRGLWIHTTIIVLCLGACFTEFISLLFQIGASNVAEWVASDLNLKSWIDGSIDDNMGWRVLEVCHLMFSGMMLWVEAFEWLAIFGALSLVYFSTRSLVMSEQNLSFTFGRCWAHLGLFIGLLALIDFAFQVLRFVSWGYFTALAIFFGVLNRLILLPMWLCLLGCQLPVAVNSVEIAKNYGPRPDQSNLEELGGQPSGAPGSPSASAFPPNLSGGHDDLMRSPDGPIS